ncbi:bssS family protein [Serratia sp. JSRIV004]|nr:bssS family protein [Serratia sp. JSRIV004]
MSKKTDMLIFPVTGWQIGSLSGHYAFVPKFQFITSPIQQLEEAQETQFFGITPDIAKAMIADLKKHIETVEKSSGAIHPSEKH